MFKVGDRLIVTGTMGHLILMGSKVTVLEIGDNPSAGLYKVADEDGFEQWVYHDDLKPISPPQKITQNGYEYELVGPVKPDWLVDGAWVVRKDNGCKHQVVLNKNGLLVLTMPGTDATILLNHHIYDQYRPHTASDWKWGDWAMYAGKRVFVVGGVDNAGRIFVSYPDIYPLGKNDADRNFLFVPSSKLTPTF